MTEVWDMTPDRQELKWVKKAEFCNCAKHSLLSSALRWCLLVPSTLSCVPGSWEQAL